MAVKAIEAKSWGHKLINQHTLRIKNVKFSGYCFWMNTNR